MFTKDRFLNVMFMLLVSVYLISLVLEYCNFNFDSFFGYLDHQLWWQGLSDLSVGKVIYRDFYWDYGPLYLVIGLPFFFLLNKTFLSSIFIRTVILPAISILLSFFLGKKLLNKKFLIWFLSLLFLYRVNNDFTSLRHLLPEFGLLTLILGSEFKDKGKIYVGSIFLGLSLISSVEYGIVANISAAVYFLISLFRKQEIKSSARKFLAIESAIALPYFLLLWKSGALKNMVVFFSEYMHAFYYNSPCRDLFPRLPEINTGIQFLQRLNLYLIPLLLIVLAIWIFASIRKSQWSSIIFTLIVYTALVFYRPLNTPCLDYMNYGLFFLFLILIFISSLSGITSKLRWFLRIALIWFIILPIPQNVFRLVQEMKTFNTQDVSERKFLPIAGLALKKELTDEYLRIVNFIQTNTDKNDSIYVYPNGPYYQLSQRKSAVSIASSWYYDLSPSLIKTTVNQLETKEPKLVVINTYNASSLKTNLSGLTYNIHSEGNNLVYEGIITPVEDYICSNYEIIKKLGVAWILQKRNEPTQIKKLYLPIDKGLQWKIEIQGLTWEKPSISSDSLVFQVKRSNPAIGLRLGTSENISQIRVPLKVDLGVAKIFSKYLIDVYVAVDNGNVYLAPRQFATSDWQDVWISLPLSNTRITRLLIIISDNKGFLWFGKPKEISLKQPEAFIYNPYIKTDKSAFKLKFVVINKP